MCKSSHRITAITTAKFESTTNVAIPRKPLLLRNAGIVQAAMVVVIRDLNIWVHGLK
ncbi:MAG: hypothetical protein H6995_01665 [Pseudomonadales bacterium]|nr:hypothetical protein [Pseudomonadales bacterium]